MDFVDRHRLVHLILVATAFHPVIVFPSVVIERRDDRCGSWWEFSVHSVRIRFVYHLAVLHSDAVLIFLPRSNLRDKQFPDAGRDLLLHAVRSPIPMIEIANHLHALRVGCPDREIHARVSTNVSQVRA